MAGKRLPNATDLEFHERLRSNDEHVIGEVVWRLGPAVRQRLRAQFGNRLNEDDLDDVLSAAQYRLWRYRHRYEPSRGSIGHWFYLIARSAAVDFIRRTPQVMQLSHQQWGAIADSPPGPQHLTAHQRETSDRVGFILQRLSDIDRRIVMTFAAAEGEKPWTGELSRELAMPPSTIRSRKRRALSRLRQLLCDLDVRHGEETMLNASHSDALQKHTKEIEAVVDRLRKSYDVPDLSGLSLVATEWNRLLEKSEREGAEHEREMLKDDYLWYRTLDTYEQEYRRQIAGFLERVRHERENDFARTTFADRPIDDAIGKLELTLSDVSGTINLAMPDHVRREASGYVTLVWQHRDNEPDAELFWEPEGKRIGLRSAICRGLRYSARLGHDDVAFFTGSLVDEVCNVHELEIPEFHYEPGLAPRAPPARLLWEKSETTLAGAGELPEWMTDEGPAPKELELEHAVSRLDPALAELIDRVLCAAALEDYSQAETLSPEKSAQRVSAVEELVDVIAKRVGAPRDEVVRLFAPALVDRQSRAEGRIECAANTKALRFLLSQLTEH